MEFGFSGNENFSGFPNEYELLGTFSEVKEEDYTVTYHLDSDWGSGFCGSISIANNTDIVLEDWVLEFDFDREITGIWNGVIETHEGNHYIIKNAGYNSNIAGATSVSIGFCGNEGTAEIVPDNFELYSYGVSGERIDAGG